MYLDGARVVHPLLLLPPMSDLSGDGVSRPLLSQVLKKSGRVLVTDHVGVILWVVTALCIVPDTGKCDVDPT